MYNDNNIKSDKEEFINPKKRFLKDLKAVLNTAMERQSDIILTGDFNDVIGDGNNDLTILTSSFDLIDVHANKHGFDHEIATYKRGKRRIDYLLASRRLTDHVIRCGYEKFDARIVSDHRGYFVDFSIPGIFDRRLPQLFSQAA